MIGQKANCGSAKANHGSRRGFGRFSIASVSFPMTVFYYYKGRFGYCNSKDTFRLFCPWTAVVQGVGSAVFSRKTVRVVSVPTLRHRAALPIAVLSH
jgi:hypothetical protein